MDNFKEDEKLEELLGSVVDRDDRFLSVAFMVADDNGIREELAAYLSSGARSQEEVWLEIASLCQLKVYKLKNGSSLIYPQVKTVRFCVDVRRGAIGSGSLKHLSSTEACIIVHLDCEDPCAWEPIFDYLEADDVNSHYESAFVLVADDGTPDKDICLTRGYTPSIGKDKGGLRRCLGARVVYDEVLSKKL